MHANQFVMNEKKYFGVRCTLIELEKSARTLCCKVYKWIGVAFWGGLFLETMF